MSGIVKKCQKVSGIVKKSVKKCQKVSEIVRKVSRSGKSCHKVSKKRQKTSKIFKNGQNLSEKSQNSSEMVRNSRIWGRINWKISQYLQNFRIWHHLHVFSTPPPSFFVGGGVQKKFKVGKIQKSFQPKCDTTSKFLFSWRRCKKNKKKKNIRSSI